MVFITHYQKSVFMDKIEPSIGKAPTQRELYHNPNIDEEEEKKKSAEKDFKDNILKSAFLMLLRKIFLYFSGSQDSQEITTLSDSLFIHLTQLKNSLYEVSKTNSPDEKTIYELSTSWKNIITDCYNIEALHTGDFEALSKVKKIIEHIQGFPPNDEHSLGYYLSEYLGGDWLPMPFREILNNLSIDSRMHPEKNFLTNIINKIEEAISLLT